MARQVFREATVVVKFDSQNDADDFRVGAGGLLQELRVLGIRCTLDVDERMMAADSAAEPAVEEETADPR